MGNPNRFEGQIFAKKSCRGPKYRLLYLCFYYSFSRLFCEIAIFKAFRRAALKSLKGRRLPMAELGTVQRSKQGNFEKKSIEPFLRNRPIVVFFREFINKLIVFDTLFAQILHIFDPKC
jgi:hypothetical protein